MDYQTLPQREYKDRLFKAIFGRDTEESKRWRLELYNALNGTDFTDPDELKVNTIENVIYVTMHNDISFLVDDQMCLYEQQSTFNPNMPLRGFFYFGQLYHKYLTEKKSPPNDILSSRIVKIPTPRFFVFYNGDKNTEDSFKLRLSNAFMEPDKSGDFEWTAIVININKERLKGIHKSCKPLYDYARFIAKVRECSKDGAPTAEQVTQAVNWAMREKLLDGFFERQKAEVIGMILTEFDEEKFKQTCREDGYEEGLTDGARQKAMEAARSFYENGASVELIAKSLKMTVEQVKEIVSEEVSAQA